MVHRAPPALLVLGAAFSVQIGAAFATKLFDEAGSLGTVLLRVGFGALVLLLLTGRTLTRGRGRPLRWVLALGLILAVMNSLFYASLERIPLGVAVTIEFIGPLAVALAGSRHAYDVAWVVLAGAGIALLGSPTVDVDRTGLAFALGAAVCWVGYILVGKRLAASWPLASGLTASMAVATVLLLPVGIVFGDRGGLGQADVLAAGLAVALLASVIPYTLELAALRRMKASTFSILLSLEPAVAALIGALLLSQEPSLLEGLAILFVVAASIGASWQAREAPPPEA